MVLSFGGQSKRAIQTAFVLLAGLFFVAPLWIGWSAAALWPPKIAALNSLTGEIAMMIVAFLCCYLQIALWVTFLSFAYGQLMRDEKSVPQQTYNGSVASAR
jgi:hypothetical protein